MNGRSSDRPAAVVGAHLQRVFPIDQPLVGPVQLSLMCFVGCEILQWPEVWPRIERDNRKTIFGELAGERSASRPGAHDGKIDEIALSMLAHVDPTAGTEHVWRA